MFNDLLRVGDGSIKTASKKHKTQISILADRIHIIAISSIKMSAKQSNLVKIDKKLRYYVIWITPIMVS